MGKKELLKTIKPRYLKADKKGKTSILNEFCTNTGYHRKYASTILQARYEHNRIERTGRKARAKKYTFKTMSVVIKVWELLEYPCGQRLKPVLWSTAQSMIRFGHLSNLDNFTINQLKNISVETLNRRLSKEREIRKLNRNRGTTRHGSLLKSSIPIRITDWDTSKVGFMEMDTVAHNGGEPSGEFIYSLDMVEIYSGWSEQIAVLGKGERGVVKAVDNVSQIVPFRMKGVDSDGGSEFINWHMVKYCDTNNIYFTKSRPYMKNDNAYVEQKNYTHIRKWLGYSRYDNQRQLELINDLYSNELRLFNNFFRPVMKIKSKEKVNNSVCKKIYDTAKTPYQRLVESKQLTKNAEAKLKKMYLSLDPVMLKKQINKKIKIIKKLAK